MTYDQLIFLQGVAALICLGLLGLGALYLLIGLISPASARARSRWRVFGRTVVAWLLGVVIYAGTVAYTHSHPEGPHSVKRYINDYFEEQCAQGADLPACKKTDPAPGTAPQPSPVPPPAP